MIKKNGVSAETAKLCEAIQELVERAGFTKLKEFIDYAAQHGWAGAQSTHYDKLNGRKRFDLHEIKTIVDCCCQHRPDLDQKAQVDRLAELWKAAKGRGSGQPADAAPHVSSTLSDAFANDLAEGVKNLTGLLGNRDEEIARLRAENDRIRDHSGEPADAAFSTAPASEAGSPPSTSEHHVIDGEVIESTTEYWQKPNAGRASTFRHLYGSDGSLKKPQCASPWDPRRLYLGLLLLSLLAASLYWAQNLGGWTWILTGATFAVILAVVPPVELHRHHRHHRHHLRYLHSSLPAAAVSQLRWPGRPQIVWHLSPTDTHPVDSEILGVHTTFITVATRRSQTLPGYLPRDGSVRAERLTGRLRLSNCMPGTAVRWSIVNVNSGRCLAEGVLTVGKGERSRTSSLAKCKFDYCLHLREVGIHLAATGPAKVSWLAPGVSEWHGSLFSVIGWWFGIFGDLVGAAIEHIRHRHRRWQENQNERRRKHVHATLHHHRPDLPPMLQAQSTRRALESGDPVKPFKYYLYSASELKSQTSGTVVDNVFRYGTGEYQPQPRRQTESTDHPGEASPATAATQ